MKIEAVSLNLASGVPAYSVASYWYARRRRDQGDKFWIMSRGGFIEDETLDFMPPSDSETDDLVFVGEPLEVVDFINRFADAKLNITLFALGVTPRTPLATPEMLSDVAHIMALPETARWLRSCGVSQVEELEPTPRVVEMVESGSDDMSIALFGVDERALPKLPFSTTYHQLVWNKMGRVIEESEIVAAAARADVLVANSLMFDDPVREIFAAHGVACVAPEPVKDLPARLIAAARHHRDGTLLPVSPSLECIPLVSHKSDEVKLGVVVPFGGLDPEGLGSMLHYLDRSKPTDVPVVVAHQNVPGKTNEEEVQAVADLCDSLGYALQTHNTADAFRLGLARNQGFLELPRDVTHVLFLDADVRVHPAYFDMVVEEARRHPATVLVPYVGNGSVQIGSGLAVYQFDVFEKAGGFSEAFAGWGFEDVELLRRLRQEHGVPAVLIGTPALPEVLHIEHEPRWADTRDKNHAIFMKGGE